MRNLLGLAFCRRSSAPVGSPQSSKIPHLRQDGWTAGEMIQVKHIFTYGLSMYVARLILFDTLETTHTTSIKRPTALVSGTNS